MYRLFNFILLFSLIAGPAPSTRAEAQHFPLEIFDVMDDHRLVVFLHDEDIAASPQWLPGAFAPQLTISEAIRLVKRYIIDHNIQLHDAKFHEIELKPIHGHEQENRWYYLLQMQTPEKHKAYYFVVLFNGKIVPAIEEPKSIK